MKNLLELKSLKVQATPGKVIRAFRRNFNLTLADVSTLTGIPQSNLSAIENEHMDIGVKRATLIAAVFGISPSRILFPEGYERDDERQLEKIRKRAAALIEKKKVAAG